MNRKVVLLQGGYSEEREISLQSSEAIRQALIELGYEVIPVDPNDFRTKDSADTNQPGYSPYIRLGERLLEIDPYIVFIGLHGGEGENGQIQAFLSLLNIPFTGSDMKSSSLCMDKTLSFRLARAMGSKIPDYLTLNRNTSIIKGTTLPDKKVIDRIISEIGFPLVVKPNSSGSSVGITIIKKERQTSEELSIQPEADNMRDALESAVTEAFRYDEQVIAQKYVPGSELTLSVLGDRALPIVEIKVKDGWYDYRNKYTKGRTIYEVPAAISQQTAQDLQTEGLSLYKAFGCSGYARIDYRYDGEHLYFLEVNTLPGMTSLSLTPMAAKEAGISFPELIETIIQHSLRDRNKITPFDSFND